MATSKDDLFGAILRPDASLPPPKKDRLKKARNNLIVRLTTQLTYAEHFSRNPNAEMADSEKPIFTEREDGSWAIEPRHGKRKLQFDPGMTMTVTSLNDVIAVIKNMIDAATKKEPIIDAALTVVVSRTTTKATNLAANIKTTTERVEDAINSSKKKPSGKRVDDVKPTALTTD